MGMSVQEGRPGLTRRPSGRRRPHVFLDGPFAQLDAQLEQFTLDPFSTSQAIVSRHLLNQLNRFVRQARMASARLRLPSRELAEQRSMPYQDRFGFDDEGRLTPPIQPTGQPNEQTPIRVGWLHVFHATPENLQLLAQEGIFEEEFTVTADRVSGSADHNGGWAELCLVQHLLFNPA
jgi:hypothetical protein